MVEMVVLLPLMQQRSSCWCSPRGGGHRLGSDGRTAAADAVVIVVLVLSSWRDIGLVEMVNAAAHAVAIVVPT